MSPRIVRTGSAAEIGGKAAALASLEERGVPIPAWFAVLPPQDAGGATEWSPEFQRKLVAALAEIAGPDDRFAVRSSAIDEDGQTSSFAGQYETYLFVPAGDVPARIADVWRAATSARLTAYRAGRGVQPVTARPAVIVQRMLDPEVAGVAFSADPSSGRRGVCVISAAFGVGAALVGGDIDGDTFRVRRDGVIEQRLIVRKPTALRRGPAGTEPVDVDEQHALASSLTDDQILAVAALARAAERHFGSPQDIEWAIADGKLHLLQSRPITTLAALPDPDAPLAVWDDSNIAESYGGVTTPLTFSFARAVYEAVYAEFCRLVGVPERRIADHRETLRSMLGLVRGRVYYNLVSWHRLLALFPGYALNRGFMEQMMGVREQLPAGASPDVKPPAGLARLREIGAVARTTLGLALAWLRLPRTITQFHRRLDAALDGGGDLTTLRPDELVAHYRALERQLLGRWDAPLVNDFFAMICFGVLRRLSRSWCADHDGSLANELVAGTVEGEGELLSAVPARRLVELGHMAAADPRLVETLREGSRSRIEQALAAHGPLRAAIDEYLARFGDRCLEELKLETHTLTDDPLPLFRAIAAVASAGDAAPSRVEEGTVGARGAPARRAMTALSGRPMRRWCFRWILRHARGRLRDRESLRFERTRVFGEVRRIFVELGRRYAALGALDDARDIFFLTVDEALGWPTASTAGADLRALARVRREEFARYEAGGAPPGRFETRGPAHAAPCPEPALQRWTGETSAPVGTDERRVGIGCSPGSIRARVRVVRDPREITLTPGEILVAERTDPGWVMLFASAGGVLVERGSLLSHAAIVARELGLPAVVGLRGATTWLRTGDQIEMDGRTGEVRRLSTVTERVA